MSLQDYKKAGSIAAESLNFGKKLIKEGVLLNDVTKKIEEKIRQLGGEPAFPAQISLNNAAAHCYYNFNAKDKFKAGDIVKLDVGAHVNGFIGDNACTINLGKDKDLELIRASKDALREAVSLMRPGVQLREVGKAVEEVTVGYGFNPIRNLSGHEVERFNLHAGLTIPNYDNEDDKELEEGQVFAIEPFATTGVGKVSEGKLSGIYKIVDMRNVRSGREVLNFILENYKTLPFSIDWMREKFTDFNLRFAFRILDKEGVLHNYPQLVEAENEKVSQAEHTVMVADKPIIFTKGE